MLPGDDHLVIVPYMSELVVRHLLGTAEIENRELQDDFFARNVIVRFDGEIQHLAQVIDDLQRRVILADLVKERRIGTLHVCGVETADHQTHIVFAGGHGGVHHVDGATRDAQIDAMYFDDLAVHRHDIAVLSDIGKLSPVQHFGRLRSEHVAQRGVLAAGSRHEFDAARTQSGEHVPEAFGNPAMFVQQGAVHIGDHESDILRLVDGGPVGCAHKGPFLHCLRLSGKHHGRHGPPSFHAPESISSRRSDWWP